MKEPDATPKPGANPGVSANRFYEPGPSRAERVSDLFGTIAPRYDLVNDVQSLGLHRWWKRRLVKLAGVGPGYRALDLCCGTGDIVFRLTAMGAEVVGLDFSEGMLAVARQRVERARPKTADKKARQTDKAPPTMEPKFVRGDATRLPFPDGSFDAVTVAYGLRNLADWELGLREMWRVAQPGGRLLVLDFGKPDNRVWRAAYFGYLRWVVPVFGRLFCGDAALYAYILESLRHYPAQHGVAAGLRELGCTDVRIINLLGGVMTINFGVKQKVTN